MYYAVCDSGVYVADELKKLNNMLQARLDEDEFTVLGADKITKITSIDMDFIQDKRKMSRIFFGNFFKEDKSVKIFSILSFIFGILNFLILINLGG